MYQQNYTREAERKRRRREQEREVMKELLWILALFVALLGFVWACMRAIIISAEHYEPSVVVVQEAEPIREAPEVVEEVEVCPLEVRTFYDVPLGIELQAHIINECGGYGIDPAIVFAMIERESRFQSDVVGDSGKSFGLMQIQKRWHEERMERLAVTDLLNPYENTMVGIDFLAELIDRYDGDIAKALTAYNQGYCDGIITNYAKGILERSEEINELVLYG